MADLLNIARDLVRGKPHREIPRPDGPYLDRYFLRALPDSSQLWLHWFHGGGDECYHNHAWDADVWLLRGRQSASHMLTGRGPILSHLTAPDNDTAVRALGSLLGHEKPTGVPSHYVGRNTWYRIVSTDPDTITVLRVWPGLSQTWRMLHPLVAGAKPPRLMQCGYALTPEASPHWRVEEIRSAGPQWRVNTGRAAL